MDKVFRALYHGTAWDLEFGWYFSSVGELWRTLLRVWLVSWFGRDEKVSLLYTKPTSSSPLSHKYNSNSTRTWTLFPNKIYESSLHSSLRFISFLFFFYLQLYLPLVVFSITTKYLWTNFKLTIQISQIFPS